MNIAVFAVIGILVLLIAVLVLKKISSAKKGASEETPTGKHVETDEAMAESVEEEAKVATAEAELELTAEPAEERVEETAVEEPPLEVEQFPLEPTEEEEVVAEETQAESEGELAVEETQAESEGELAAEEIPAESEEKLAVEETTAEGEGEEAAPAEPATEIQAPVIPSAVGIDFTIEQYRERLQSKEEAQRLAVADAVSSRDDRKREMLQLELVAVNEKLALLEEAYNQECTCYREVLDVLPQIFADADHDSLEEAVRDLAAGEPLPAEQLLASKMDAEGPDQAVAAFHSGRLAECRFDLETALARYAKAIATDPANTAYLHAAGLAAKKMYRYPEAIKWLGTFITTHDGDASADPIQLAGVKRDLAHTYVVAGQSQKAGPLYKQAMTVFTDALGQDHPEMATCWFQIGELQETMGEYDKAVSLYKKALIILDKAKGKDHPAVSPVLAKLAALCMELEMEKEAVPLFERLVAIREASLPPTHPQLEMSLNALAESYRLQGMHGEAEGCYLKCLAIAEKNQGKESARVGAVLQELAKLSLAQRKNEEAEQYQARATAIFDKVVEEQEKQSQDSTLSLEL